MFGIEEALLLYARDSAKLRGEGLGARFDKNPSERLAASCGWRVLHVNSLY